MKGRLPRQPSASFALIAALLVGLVVIPNAPMAKAHPSPSAATTPGSMNAAARSAQTSGQPSGRKRKLRCPTFPGADQFSTTIDNPFFPLAPGSTFTYRETVNGSKTDNDVVQVTSDTKTILGVVTVVVHDVASLPDGTPVEDTFDWYAQDSAGNVWYFGEDTKEFKNGAVVSTKGSWEAGVKGAMPGIVMEASSRVGDRYRQECADHQAADEAKVLNLSTSVSVPFGSFDNALETQETSRLDPGVVERKQYAPCIGFVRSELVKGGKEVAELVDVQTPPGGSGCESATSGNSSRVGQHRSSPSTSLPRHRPGAPIQRKSKLRPGS